MTNCYEDHGASELADGSGKKTHVKTVEECIELCRVDMAGSCTAVTITNNMWNNQYTCYRRSDVDPTK
jgi:hypothetical protein